MCLWNVIWNLYCRLTEIYFCLNMNVFRNLANLINHINCVLHLKAINEFRCLKVNITVMHLNLKKKKQASFSGHKHLHICDL